MADGFSLNIDAKFLRDLQRIDEKYQKLMDKNNQLSKSVISAYQEMSSKGVTPYVKKLQEQKEALEAIANIKLSKGAGADMRALQDGANKAVDNINRLLNALKNTKQYQKETSTFSDASKVNALYSERIELMRRLEGYVQKGMKGELVTEQESNSISVFRQRLMNIDSEIKAIQNMKTISTDVYMALIKGEIDFTNAKNAEIQKRNTITNHFKDEEKRKNQQTLDDILKYEQDKFNESLNQYRKNKDTQASVDKHYHDKRQREYEEMFRKIDELAKRESAMRSKAYSRIQSSGDTSKQAESAYNRLYSDKGIKSLNNMNRALQKLQEAQNKLNLNTDKGRQKYDELGKKIQQIKKDLDKATQANEKFHNSHSKLLNTSDQLQRKLALLFSVSAIQGYMDKLINVRKEFELQQKSLQVLLRDKDQADKLWQQTIDLAVKSPFRVSQLVSYTKQLAAYRIESDKLYDTTKMLSDVSAGLGVDMQRIILAFGQVRAANFLRGTELRQFTEAGIPMLDELAQMFTELEGRAVKAGDVFERISKRMVTFRDVEEVFKRMTSSSGVFYNMQEEQSKTLFGMISNLHDSVDLMLNDIGRSNDGIIKDMVSLTRDLVENWRGVATVLKQVGVTIAMIGLTKFATGWKIASTAITTGSTSAALAMNGMAGSAARLRIAMSTLGKTISANPWFLLVGALASAGHALWEYVEAIDASNAKYDDMSRREIAHIDQLEELQKKTEQYNAIIKDGNSSEQARNKAQLENDKILSQIKAKYPELYPLIVQQENKTIDLTKAIERQNEVLEVNIALQQKAKGDFFQEDFSENYKDALESQDALKSSLVSLQSEASQASAKLKALSSNGELPKDVAKSFDTLFKSLRKSKSLEEARVVINEINKSFSQLGAGMLGKSELHNVISEIKDDFASLWRSQQDYTNALDSWGANLDRQMDAFRVGIEDAMAGLEPSKRNKAATQWVNQQLDALGVVDKELKKWAQQYIVKETGIKLTFIEEGKKVYTEADLTKEWQKKIWGAIKKVESTNPDIRLGVTLEDVATQDLATVIKTLKESVESAIKENKNVVDVGQIVGQIAYTPKQIQNAKDSVEPLQALADVIGLIIKQTSGNKGKDWMYEVVKGIKEAHQEYIKLNKTLGDSEAKQMSLDKYAKSFAESAKNAGLKDISLGQFKFETEEGAIEALTFLKNKLPQSAKQARFKLEEAIGEIRGEVRIRTKAEDDKLLIEQIEEMFSGYEMSIELQKLNIPPDLAKQLFNIDSLTLPDLKNKLIELKPKFEGKEMLEEWDKLMKKIGDKEDKEQEERLKKYTKYLLKAQSERVKIKLEEMRQFAEIDKEDKYSQDQKETIKRSLRIETQEKLDKEAWDEFKNSEMYTQMFEDLETLGNKAIDNLLDNLENLKDSLKNLPANEVKEIMTQINKMSDIKNKRNPFASLRDAMKEVRALEAQGKTEESLQLELQAADARVKSAQNEINSIDTILNAKREGLSLDSQSVEWQNKYGQYVGLTVDMLEEQKRELGEIVDHNQNISEQSNKGLSSYAKARNALKAVHSEWESIRNMASKAYDSIKTILESMGVEADSTAMVLADMGMSLVDLVFQAISFGVQLKIMTVQAELLGVAINSALGPIGWAVLALQAIATVFSGILGLGDAKKERRIKKEQEAVEKLQRAYEKLEKAIDNAYNINSYERYIDNAQQNLKNQIAATERMIQAEEDKKKTDKDKIKDWKNEIEDMKDALKELEEDRVKGLGGFGSESEYKSATEEFVSAWLDAYKETGDGLSGLEEQFNEFFTNMVKNQLMMRGVDRYLDGFYKQFDAMFAESSEQGGKVTKNELESLKNLWASTAPGLNEFMENLIEGLGIAKDLTSGTSELSGLQRGIQGVTEETAQIIEAYLNSIRFMVASNNTYLSQIASAFGNTEVENPMVGQLRIIAQQTTAINTLLQSLTRGGHTLGGVGLKVFIS